jgi:hypothetical protein
VSRWRDHKQELRVNIPGVPEGMNNSTTEVNKIPGRCTQCHPACLNGQFSFEEVEELLLAVANVRRRTPPGGTDTSAMKGAPVSSPVIAPEAELA